MQAALLQGDELHVAAGLPLRVRVRNYLHGWQHMVRSCRCALLCLLELLWPYRPVKLVSLYRVRFLGSTSRQDNLGSLGAWS